MGCSPLTADISAIKSQLETESIKCQSGIYLRQAKIHALDVFGNSDTVQNWLIENNPALDRVTPAELLASAAGLERVIDLMNRTRSKLERLRQRINLMKQPQINPESEADFQTLVKTFDAQRSIVNFSTANDYFSGFGSIRTTVSKIISSAVARFLANDITQRINIQPSF